METSAAGCFKHCEDTYAPAHQPKLDSHKVQTPDQARFPRWKAGCFHVLQE